MRRYVLLPAVLALAAGAVNVQQAHAVDVLGCTSIQDGPGHMACQYVAVTTQGKLTLSNAIGSVAANVLCGEITGSAWERAYINTEGSVTYDQLPGELCYVYAYVYYPDNGLAFARGDNVT
jgi:hypothetical protein